ncbi:MAG: GTP-binding protein [Lewinellaceae bacterium]|nr:GTP-binding protein [Phaeodactylibacter sp.]MCB9037146.1 GTP-binding protein [Lewinellaceae bacterium]
MTTKKVLITGSSGVGKTSIFNRFVHDTFSERPLSAIGLRVDKKVMEANGQPLALILWEIKGEVSREKVPRTYFMGASAAVYVFDLSRPGSLKNMEADLALIRRALPGCLVRVVGNKKDLLSREELLVMERETRADCFTSARTGENVEALFREVGQELMKQ